MDLTIDLQDFSRKNVYEMVETTAYFEAYNPILEGLQQTEDNDLPFQVGKLNIFRSSRDIKNIKPRWAKIQGKYIVARKATLPY